MKFQVIGDSKHKFKGESGDMVEIRRLLLTGANGDLNEQICELNLRSDYPAPLYKSGEQIEVHVRQVKRVFNGKATLSGTIAQFEDDSADE